MCVCMHACMSVCVCVCVVFSLARYDTVSGTQREIQLVDTTSTPSCWPSKVGPSFSVLLSRQLTQQSPCLVTMALFTGKRTHRGWQSPSPQCLWMRCPANGHGYLKWLTFRISFEVGLNLMVGPLTSYLAPAPFAWKKNLQWMAVPSINQMVFFISIWQLIYAFYPFCLPVKSYSIKSASCIFLACFRWLHCCLVLNILCSHKLVWCKSISSKF